MTSKEDVQCCEHCGFWKDLLDFDVDERYANNRAPKCLRCVQEIEDDNGSRKRKKRKSKKQGGKSGVAPSGIPT